MPSSARVRSTASTIFFLPSFDRWDRPMAASLRASGVHPGRLAQGPDEKSGRAGRMFGFVIYLSLTEELHSGGGAWPAADIGARPAIVNAGELPAELLGVVLAGPSIEHLHRIAKPRADRRIDWADRSHGRADRAALPEIGRAHLERAGANRLRFAVDTAAFTRSEHGRRDGEQQGKRQREEQGDGFHDQRSLRR